MNEKKYMDVCLYEIEDKLQWGKLTEWTGHNFDQLSEEINEKTGIKLSGRTLRRLVNHKISNPQIATKNALAKFLDYKNWEDYVVSHSNGNGHAQLPRQKKQRNFSKFVAHYFWAILIVVVITLSSFFILFYPSIELELNKARVEFRSNNLVGKAPHTASFYYDVSKIKTSNIFVDNNYYDESNILPLKKNMHFYSKTFELPDYYAVKIIANGERMACVRVHVVTDGWEYVLGGEHFNELPRDSTNDWLYINPQTLKSNSLVSTDSVYHIEYRNIRNFEAKGDQMTFETRFKNNSELGGVGCFDSKIEVINLHGRLSFNFLEPGCDQKRLRAEFGDVALSGEFNNLNTFFQDVSYWRVLKIVTKKKNVSVFLDDVQIYSVKYNDPLDQVKGLSFKFKGAGAVDYVKLYNESNELVYEDNFNLNE